MKAPTSEDLARSSQWSKDPVIVALDPPAGEVRDPLLWSIYTDNGTHIGFASMYNRTPTDVEIGARIGERSFWGQGHGTWVIREVVEHCWKQGVSRVHLKVLPANIRAIRCYEKCGFKRCGEKVIDGMLFILMEVKNEHR